MSESIGPSWMFELARELDRDIQAFSSQAREKLLRIITKAAEQERERCAREAETYALEVQSVSPAVSAAKEIARRIRDRQGVRPVRSTDS